MGRKVKYSPVKQSVIDKMDLTGLFLDDVIELIHMWAVRAWKVSRSNIYGSHPSTFEQWWQIESEDKEE